MNSHGDRLCRWHAFSDEQTLQQAAFEIVAADAAQAIRERGQFHFVLAGGNTPRGLYAELCSLQTDWPAWHIYFGDERCLEVTDESRNSRMASDVWLDRVPIPDAQLHPIRGEMGAIQAARMYADLLQTVGDFDLVLLGLGEDGHTASLFPDHNWGVEATSPATLAVFDAPKPPPERVSLSAARLSRARKVIFMVSGEAKHQAVIDWRAGKNIPARAVMPAVGVDVLVESALLRKV